MQIKLIPITYTDTTLFKYRCVNSPILMKNSDTVNRAIIELVIAT